MRRCGSFTSAGTPAPMGPSKLTRMSSTPRNPALAAVGQSSQAAFGPLRLAPRGAVQLGVLREALGCLIRRVGAQRVQEDTARRDDVLGDHDVVARLGVHIGVDAAQGADTGRLGDIAVETHLTRPQEGDRPSLVGEVPLGAQCRHESVGQAAGALDGEPGVGGQTADHGTRRHAGDLNAGKALGQGVREPLGTEHFVEGCRHSGHLEGTPGFGCPNT